jgi:hypothetical protein
MWARGFAHCHAFTTDGDFPVADGDASTNCYLHPADTNANLDCYANTDRHARTADSYPHSTDANSPASHRHRVCFWL